MLLNASHLFDRRVLFFGGKGGVGKTTCASAVSLAAARSGRRVLLVSTDPAHSTSDIFQRPFAREEREVLPSLFGLEVDAEYEARRYLGEVKGRISTLFSPGVVRQAMRQIDLVAGMPGLADVALFDRMADLVLDRSRAYDFVVFDTAPTGHTLRLLHMPEAMGAWVQALADRRREALENADADPILSSLTRRRAKLASLRDLLTRYETTGFVLVLIPERLPIEESARALHELEHAHLHVGGVIVNRVLPPDLSGAYYEARKAQESVYLEEVERRFRGVPRVMVPQLESDIHGVGSLERVARHVLGTTGA